MIEVRVAIGDIAPNHSGTTLEECDELLLPQGFTRLAFNDALKKEIQHSEQFQLAR